MGVRQIGRHRALQLLYALEFRAPDDTFGDVERAFLRIDPSLRRGWGPFPRALALAVFEHAEDLDRAIGPMLKSWSIDRLPRAERLCLRLALAELRYFEDIPLRVTINESIELARLFGTDDSTSYINAVLDRLGRDFPQKDFQNGADDDSRDGAPDAPPRRSHPASGDPA